MDPDPLPSCIKKRKALDLDQEAKITESLSKRVSFSSFPDSSQFPSINPSLSIDSSLLLDLDLDLSKDKQKLESILTRPSFLLNPLNQNLSSFSQTLNLSSTISEDHLSKLKSKQEKSQKTLPQLLSQKQKTIEICESIKNQTLEAYMKTNSSFKQAKQESINLKLQLEKERKKKQAIKEIAQLLGVKYRDHGESKTVEVNDFSFKVEKSEDNYVVAQLAGPEKLLMEGKNRLFGYELGTFFFRVIDRE